MSEIRASVDSREGFTLAEQIAYFEQCEPSQADLDAAEVPSDEDYAEMDVFFASLDDEDDLEQYEDDGQPDMQQEYDDLYGYGPEWDYDCYDE